MSSIPNSAMPHAKVHHDDDHKPKPDAKKTSATSDWVEDATDAAKAGLATATDAVKSHPKTAIAVGATVIAGIAGIAGIAAAIAAPALRAKDAAEKKAPPKKPESKKPAKAKKPH
ncbi:hypothetical protein [Sphingomonas sp. OK281]|uniref:hypothetical protein n=1 Tax=Sphingomonas sp. OK281 TaxID=1881067 RepID=UPI0008EF3322|nr:hypothetical protein [Sphingomonas sp. OK281]SFN76662.1 hypothetical protein SAMN05428984_0658 [Sphingomonas sp. OK281]